MFARPGKRFLFLIRVSPHMVLPVMKTLGISAFAGALLIFVVMEGKAQSLPSVADPLVLTSTFTPSVSFSETHAERVVKTLTDPADPTSAVYSVVPTLSTTATITANITGIVLADIDGTTAFSTTFGGTSISFLLGDIRTYVKGNTTAFYCWNGWNGTQPLGTGGVKLTWTATKLTVTVTMAATDDPNLRPSPIGTEGFVDTANDPGVTPGTFPIKDVLTVDLTFGSVSSSGPRTVYMTGSNKITHVSAGPVDLPLYDYDLYAVTVSGAADYTRPSVVLTSPKQGASVGAAVDVNGTASDAKGLQGVEWTTDLTSGWTAADSFTLTAAPLDGLWGPTSAAWTVSLASLPYGTTKLYLRSSDDSGNPSLPLLLTLVNPVPTLLTGRWDALLVPDVTNGVRGAINFTFAVNGSYTGTLVMEGARYPFTGTLLPDETIGVSISRGKALPVDFTGTITSFSPVGAGAAGITGDLESNGTHLAAVNAFRSPWSATNLADASLAGSFHVQIAAAATPTGNSYAVVTTARTGGATAVFSLADGTVVTWNGVMGATGQLPAFASLYVTVISGVTTAGSISVPMGVNGGARTIDATTVTWVRPASFTDKQFPAGFLYNTLAASGIAYAAPSPASVRVMGLGSTSLNATASWSGDGVTASPSLGITVNAGNTLTIPVTTDALKLSLVASTGLWTGSFKIPGTTVLSACKLLIVGNQAYGFWTAPAPTGSTLKRYGLIHVQ